MRYQIMAPESEAVLATVDDAVPSADTSVHLSNGVLEISGPRGARIVLPVRSDHGRLIVSTALGSLTFQAVRESVFEGSATGRSGLKVVKSSMPGKILKILCKPGDTVEAGQPLLIIEAMKMENEIRCPQAGKIEEISVEIGQKVEAGGVLLKLGAIADV